MQVIGTLNEHVGGPLHVLGGIALPEDKTGG